MLRISKLADYATVIMSYLAMERNKRLSAPQIAKQLHLTVPTVSKILKLLSEADIVIAARGVGGGYRLAKSPQEITLAEIIVAIDGIPAMTECSQNTSVCAQDAYCSIKGNWQMVNQMILRTLRGLTLADMTKPLTTHPLFLQPWQPRVIAKVEEPTEC